MVNCSLPVMFAHFLSVDRAMSTREKMGISLVLSAKADTRGTKVGVMLVFCPTYCFSHHIKYNFDENHE